MGIYRTNTASLKKALRSKAATGRWSDGVIGISSKDGRIANKSEAAGGVELELKSTPNRKMVATALSGKDRRPKPKS